MNIFRNIRLRQETWTTPSNMENLLEAHTALKRYTPEALGQGKARSGGPAARKLRFEVMDRMAKIGSGLSASQCNDWVWFREAWDARMCEEHAENWGVTFCGWMQKVLDDFEWRLQFFFNFRSFGDDTQFQ